MNKNSYFRLILGVGILTTIFGIVVILTPSTLWHIMNWILGFILVLSGISSIVSAIKNINVSFIWLLLSIGILSTIFGILLICGSAGNFIGKLTIILFALWALMRGCLLLFHGIQSKDVNKLWIAELILGGLLLILAILTFCDINSATSLAGICIGISILFDGISLCFLSFKIKNSDTIQVQITQQVVQPDDGQSNVVIEGTVISNNKDQL